VDRSKITLLVPEGTEASYIAAGWTGFKEMKGFFFFFFDSGGGSAIETQAVCVGEKVTAPVRDGYILSCYKDGGKWDFNTVVPANITLVVQWDIVTYSITYAMDGGVNHAGNPATYTVESPAITLQAPTRGGYTFAGWAEGNSIAAGSTGDKTFTAQWNTIPYNIVYDLNGGVNHVGNPATYNIESPAITLQDPTREGYTFAGWAEGSSIAAGSTGNKTFTAQWTENLQPPTGVETLPESSPLQAWIHNGLLHVSGLTAGETLSIYSAAGQLVYKGVAASEEADIPLRAQGVYIVQSGEKTVTVIFN
jgi:uncharacterized repeat protein (TIGR02543 family)